MVDLRLQDFPPLLQIMARAEHIDSLLFALLEGDGRRRELKGEFEVKIEGKVGLGPAGGFDQAVLVNGGGDVALIAPAGLAGEEQLAEGTWGVAAVEIL